MQLWNIDTARAAPSLLAQETISYSGMPLSEADLARRERYLGAQEDAPAESLIDAILAERRGGNMAFPVEIFLGSQRGSLAMIGDALPLALTHEKSLPMVKSSRALLEEMLMATRQIKERPGKHVLCVEEAIFLSMGRDFASASRLRDGVAAAMAHECEAWLTEPIAFERGAIDSGEVRSKLARLTLRSSDCSPRGQGEARARQALDDAYGKRERQALKMLELLGGLGSMAILPPHPAGYQISEACEALRRAFVSGAQIDNALAEALEISKGMEPAPPLSKRPPRI